MANLKPGWKIVKFGDVVQNANSIEQYPEDAGIERIVGLEHIDPESLHIRRWNGIENGTSFSRKFTPDQTLFGKRRAYQRKVAFAEFGGICSGDILTFKAKDPEILLPSLLPFICQSDFFFDYALSTSDGSLSPRTSWSALKKFEFSLPPMDEQKRIAEILWAADEVVEKYYSAQSRLNTTKVRLITDLAHHNHDTSQQYLGNYIRLEYGKALPESKRTGTGFAVIGSNGNVGQHDQFLIKGPCIIVGRKGGAGEVAWVEVNCWPIDTTFYVVLKNQNAILKYIYYLLKNLKLQRYVITTAVPGLNRKDVYNRKVSIPNIETQRSIIDKLDKTEKVEAVIAEHIVRLNTTKKILLDSLLGGGSV